MKKPVLAAIRKRAADLPPLTETTGPRGIKFTELGAVSLHPIETQVNHVRRMRHAYETGGVEGILAYENKVRAIVFGLTENKTDDNRPATD